MASDEQVIEAYRATDPMESVGDICERLNISPNRIYSLCRKYNIPTRRSQGISARTENPSVLAGYSAEVREMIRVSRFVERIPLTQIAAKMEMPYAHVRLIAARIRIEDEKAIESADTELIMAQFAGGMSLDELRIKHTLTAAQLLIVLDSERGAGRITDWGQKQAIVEEVLERLRMDLKLQDGQARLI